MKIFVLALAAAFLPAVATAAPLVDGIAIRPRGPGLELQAAGRLGRLGPAELADADRLVAALPEAIALPPAVRAPGAFRLAKAFPVRAGGLVQRLEQRIDGVPVEGASLSVRLDDRGEIRWSLGQVFDPARANAPRPSLSAREAVARANAFSRVPSANLDRARLVYLPAGADLVLAYRVDLPAQPGTTLEAPTVWIDAASGEVLKRVNRIRFAHQAKVWPENPISTPDLITVSLPDLPAEANQLAGEWVVAKNCVDEHETVTLSSGGQSFSIHVCTERNKATADANGDFFFDPVLDLWNAAGNEDDFAEVHGYYHVNRAYEFFRGLGLEQVNTKPLPTIVNYRYAFGYDHAATWENAQNPYGQLFPYDNAFFLPAGQGIFGEDRPFESIVFGQGSEADFGYDGGVFYHEFTHAVVEATANLGWSFLDEYGLDGSPGALNEGFADYFSHAITGDPVIGEYANGGYGAIRTAENDATCPDSLVGETHEDSNVWTGALWDIREELGAELDRAVFVALTGLPSEVSFQGAAEAVIAEIATHFDDGAAARARAIFESRGLLGCNNRVIELKRSGEGRDFMYLGGGYMGYNPMPSYIQFRIEAKNEIRELFATVHYIYSDRDYPADVRVVAKVGDEPIKFRSPFAGRVSGDWDHEAAFDGSFRGGVAEFETPLPAGPMHFALINRGVTEAMIGDFEIEWTEAPGSGGSGGEGGTGGTGGTPEEKPRRGGGSDSGCAQTGGSAGAAGLLVAAALFFRRRRA